MYEYSFEKLEVLKQAKEFTKCIYLLTSKFPENEKFGLIAQLRRASISVCSNLAEGSARNSFRDKAHFTTMAFSSAVEIVNQLIISYELKYVPEKDYLKLRSDMESITNKLNSLRNFQINKSNEQITK